MRNSQKAYERSMIQAFEDDPKKVLLELADAMEGTMEILQTYVNDLRRLCGKDVTITGKVIDQRGTKKV